MTTGTSTLAACYRRFPGRARRTPIGEVRFHLPSDLDLVDDPSTSGCRDSTYRAFSVGVRVEVDLHERIWHSTGAYLRITFDDPRVRAHGLAGSTPSEPAMTGSYSAVLGWFFDSLEHNGAEPSFLEVTALVEVPQELAVLTGALRFETPLVRRGLLRTRWHARAERAYDFAFFLADSTPIGSGLSSSRPSGLPVDDVSRRVFVVHGRDDVLRSRMFDLLRALNLLPLEWEPIVAGGHDPLPFLNEVIARELDPGRVQAVLVLLTPEDIVHLHPSLHEHDEQAHERYPVMQARPNVLVELGMALSSHRGRTVVVEVGRVRPAADLAGLNFIRFDGSPASLKKLAERLKTAGCPVDDQGSDWLDPRRFAALDAYHRSVPVQEPDPDVL